MEDKKYELTDETMECEFTYDDDDDYEDEDETKEYECKTLHRIRALKNFGDVKKGDLGGWIQKKENLSQEGNCWVFQDAVVFDNAKVGGNASVYGEAWVYENAEVYGNASVSG